MRPISQAKFGIVVALALLLASCREEPSDKSAFTDAQRDEITDIAGDVTDDEISDNGKILELEERIEKLEQRINR